MNRDNLWNDPYHASQRTWDAYHRKRSHDRSLSQDGSIPKQQSGNFGKRILTRDQFKARRDYNINRAKSASYVRLPNILHRRQDVCSGLTDRIGGDLRDLPYKALRNVMTPLIESLDIDAKNRLEDRLAFEQREAEAQNSLRAQRRLEFQEDLRNRKKFFATLERCSGIPARTESITTIPKSSERTEQLALPRAKHPPNISGCLEALELVNISTPEVFENLHKRVS